MSAGVDGGHIPSRRVLSRRGDDTRAVRHVASTEANRHGEDSQHEQASHHRVLVNVRGRGRNARLGLDRHTRRRDDSNLIDLERSAAARTEPATRTPVASAVRDATPESSWHPWRPQTVTDSHSTLGRHGTRDATSWMIGIGLPSGKRRAHWKSGCRRVIARSALRYSGRCPRPIVP